MRAWIYVSQPSRLQVEASLKWGARGGRRAAATKRRTVKLGTFALRATERKKLRIPIPKRLRRVLPAGRRVSLQLVIRATPDAAPGCLDASTSTRSLRTRLVHILKHR